MGAGQRIATIALVLLALICGMAFLARGGGSGGSSASPSSGFTPASYGASESSGSAGSGQSSASPDDSSGQGDQIALSDLPEEAQATVARIDAGGPYPYNRDGVVFGNFERHLPVKPRGWYHEYTVRTPGASNRGARRIITGKDGTLYYTADHYDSFRRVRR